jgi:hypothetical protein
MKLEYKYKLTFELYFNQNNYYGSNFFNILVRYYNKGGYIDTNWNTVESATKIYNKIIKILNITYNASNKSPVSYGLLNYDIKKLEYLTYMLGLSTKHISIIKNSSGLSNGLIYNFVYDNLKELNDDFDFRLNQMKKMYENKEFNINNILNY